MSNDYLEKREQLEDLFCVDATTPGCRMELVEEMISEWGMTIDDLVGRFSDDQIVDAIHYVMQVNGSIHQLETMKEENVEAGCGDQVEGDAENDSRPPPAYYNKRPSYSADTEYLWTD
jgi:hypothetical protein